MPRTSITETEIREALIAAARELFLENGIRAVEIKTIAEKAGLHRSTLYRHAMDKNQLAFYVVEQEMRELVALDLERLNALPSRGYDRLEAFCHLLLDDFESRPNLLRLLNEFDAIYTDDYPDIPEANDYVITMQRLHHSTVQLVLEGLADHSLTNIPDVSAFSNMLNNTILGLSLRFFPREKHYAEEQNASGRKTIEEFIRITLSAVKA
ncbi:MAG: TetR/AcrR family transcriptional regulator [Clostridia bacterium]|nr:TetR/AcrR family transcriptional regulator [Clostridia bacterium]